MSFYSQELVEEIRSRNDIVDVVSSYVKLQRKGSNYVGVCPFHNDHSPSMSVNQPRQIYHCFSCGAGGDVFKFVMEYENLTFPEAMKVLADRQGIGPAGAGQCKTGPGAGGFKKQNSGNEQTGGQLLLLSAATAGRKAGT